jgi:hypothetical protein
MKVGMMTVRETRVLFGLLPAALLLSACGNGGGGGGQGGGLSPILQVGMQRQYVGTSTRSVVYANPTTSTPNNTLVYSFTENQAVMQAPSSTGANFDVQSNYTYQVIQDPGVGTVPISQTVDNYENLLVSAATQMTQTLGQNSVVVSNDETSNALGDGPYTETTTTATTYSNPRESFSIPLQSGATMNVPQSSSQTISFTDVNSGGSGPPNGSNVGYSRTRTENTDGSFSYQTTYVNGNSLDLTENSDGSGTYTSTTSTATTTTTLSVPSITSQASVLPVTRTTGSTTTNYSAADWYTNNGEPNSPLILQAENVVGPTSTLPSDCSGAILRPDIYEIDTTTTSQNTISPTYAVTTTRTFNADGVTVCTLSQETSSSYDLLTGELVSTTTTQTQSVLNAINY